MIKKRIISTILFFIVFVLISGCNPGQLVTFSSPVKVTKKFMGALNSNKPAKALDLICESMVIPSLSKDYLKNLNYEEISNDGVLATVHVTGEIRLENEDLGALKKNLDFTFLLEKNGNDWCIQRNSLTNIINSLIDITY
ncbi:hypothetical protein SDC9_66855 [bioreactor metagenome]|uniref:DUF4878 domain-containing protein n=1 Tax=bioreactor metagenome TaxID=1076179 RepID=A0A644XW60_9ZZZZ